MSVVLDQVLDVVILEGLAVEIAGRLNWGQTFLFLGILPHEAGSFPPHTTYSGLATVWSDINLT